ncbi:MAG TPA: hypothetical protein VGE91_02615 [Solirubrobacterales bacterium]|jgi:hypothetical protein
MPARLIFKCKVCGTRAEGPTHAALEAQLQELLFGTYLDAQPGNWLVWHGGGLYGSTLYACGRIAVRERVGPGWRQGWGPTV